MRFGLLGPLEVVDESGSVIDVGGRQPRLVLAMLLAAAGRQVTADAIAEELWGDDRPPGAAGTLQSYISRLRRKFAAVDGGPTVLWEDPGYRLDVGGAEVDVAHFERLADEGRAALDDGRPEAAERTLAAAEALWRGPALAEFADRDFASGLATRLDERRVAAIEDRYEAALRLGRHGAVVGELAELVGRYPLRERLREHLALALYRSGRQADALRALDDARRTLRDELGVDPGRPLRVLETAILEHDPALDLDVSRGAVLGSPPGPEALPETGPLPARPELIGRAGEVREVLAALAESAHDARVVVVEGEPGIGKTRLAEEVAARAASAGADVVWGRGYEGGAAPALWPWLAPLRELAERHGGDAGLGDVESSDGLVAAGGASLVRFERFEAIARFLERAASAAPVVIVLDDLHWADDTSLDLLTFLTSRLRSGVLLLVTIRRLEVGRNDALTEALATVARRPGSRRLQLRGLTEHETGELLEALTGRPVSTDVAAALHARCEGNPFYATELTRLVLDDDHDPAAITSAEVPAGVGDVIRRRLANLPAETAELLSAGAVVGRDVEVGLLSRVAGLDPDGVLDRLDPAVVHRLLVGVPDRPATFRFCHALVREVLVDDLSPLRRARFHLRVADAIEAGGAGDDDIEVLAEHLWRAVPVGVGQRAAAALEQAAEVSLRRVAFGAAEDLLRRAVDLRRTTGTSPGDAEAELVAIHRMLAVARARRYFAGATTPQLLDRAKDLAARTGRRDLLGDVLWVEWSAASTASRIDDTERLADAFVEVLEENDDADFRAFAHDVRGVMAWQDGRIADALVQFDTAVEMRRASITEDPSLDFAGERQILGHLFGLMMHALAGDLPDVGARFEAMIEGQHDRFVITEIAGFGSVVAEVLGDWERAERWGRKVLEVDRDADFSFYSAMTLMVHAVALAIRGEVDEASRIFHDARARYCGVGGGSSLASHDASWAIALARAGRVEDAAAAAVVARRTQTNLREQWNEPIVLLAEAVVAEVQGDAAVAAERYARAVAVATAQGSHAVARRIAAMADDAGVDVAVP